MSNVLGVVELDSTDGGSGGSGPWIAERRLGNRCLLEWVARRATEAQQLDRVVVLTASLPAAARRLPPDIQVLAIDAPDSLARLARAVERLEPAALVRISLTSPFIDPALIDRLISDARQHAGCDYVSYCLRDGRPAALSRIGIFAEWLRPTAVEKADRMARSRRARRSLAGFICRHPEIFQLRFLPAPERLDQPDLRLALGQEEDWEHAQTILEALGAEGLDWQRIMQLLDHQPGIRQRMARLNESETRSRAG